MVDKMKELDAAVDELNDQVESIKSFGKVLERIDKLIVSVETQDQKASENLQRLEIVSKQFRLGMKLAVDHLDEYQEKNTDLVDGLTEKVTALEKSLGPETSKIAEAVSHGIKDISRVLSDYQGKNRSLIDNISDKVIGIENTLRYEVAEKSEEVRKAFKINTIVTLTALASFVVWIVFSEWLKS